MKYTIHIFLILILIKSLPAVSQDVHFTNYRAVSNYFNPAQTGDFAGFIKIQMGTRTQYHRTYEHGLLGAEINIQSPLNKSHWISASVNALYDVAGALSFKTTGGGLALAYHWSLDKKQQTIISIGAGLDNFSFNVDASKARTELGLLGKFDPDKMPLSDLRASVNGINAGVHVKTKINKKNSFQFGFAMLHLNEPKFTIIDATQKASLGSRINVHSGLRSDVSKMLTLEPAIYVSFSERQKNVNVQMMSEWKFAKTYKWKGVFGLSHRIGESIDIITGYSAPKLYVALSFDILATSSLDLVGNPSAIELGAYYIMNRNYVPKVKPVIFCPRL